MHIVDSDRTIIDSEDMAYVNTLYIEPDETDPMIAYVVLETRDCMDYLHESRAMGIDPNGFVEKLPDETMGYLQHHLCRVHDMSYGEPPYTEGYGYFPNIYDFDKDNGVFFEMYNYKAHFKYLVKNPEKIKMILEFINSHPGININIPKILDEVADYTE